MERRLGEGVVHNSLHMEQVLLSGSSICDIILHVP